MSGIAGIVINEVLTASTPPAVDKIELFNPTGAAVDIGGWFLTDDRSAPKKFRVSNDTLIPGVGFVVFDETQFNPTPGTNGSFSLSSQGEDVYLFSGDANTNLTGYSHGFHFGPAAAGVSFGRYVNSAGEEQFPAQISNSFSNPNSSPRVGPVVINEIHYHPDAAGDEFVELQNNTASAVSLYDIAHPANTWKLAGLDFTFPTNITLEPNGLLLLVATNPPDFRQKYSVPTNVIIVGPYTGVLQDSGERLELKRPDAPDTNGVFYITVDEVRYNDKAPWPPAADGSGPSLQRKEAGAYGNDPINWQAAIPTPGLPNGAPDADGDGLPDAWEIAHGTNPMVADASDDPDGDGYTNWQEYLAGTDPQSAESHLKVDAVSVSGSLFSLHFQAISNRTYNVLVKNSLGAPDWAKFNDVAAAPSNRVVTFQDSTCCLTNRFYRLLTPAAP